MSFQLGLLPFLGGILGAIAILQPRPGEATRAGAEAPRAAARMVRLPNRAEAAFMALVTLVAVFLMTQGSSAIWKALPFGDLIQFPWRLLALTMVTLALLTGAGVRWLEGTSTRWPGPYVYAAALIVVMASWIYIGPELQPVRPEDESPVAVLEFELAYKDMRGMTQWSERPPADGDSPLVPQYLAGQPLQRAAILSGEGQILEQHAGAITHTARVRAASDVRLRFYVYYFPGWQATIDGHPAQARPEGPNGLIVVAVPPGEHEVRLHFGPTPIRQAGRLLSLAGLAGCALLFLADRKRDSSR